MSRIYSVVMQKYFNRPQDLRLLQVSSVLVAQKIIETLPRVDTRLLRDSKVLFNNEFMSTRCPIMFPLVEFCNWCKGITGLYCMIGALRVSRLSPTGLEKIGTSMSDYLSLIGLIAGNQDLYAYVKKTEAEILKLAGGTIEYVFNGGH